MCRHAFAMCRCLPLPKTNGQNYFVIEYSHKQPVVPLTSLYSYFCAYVFPFY